jgi:HK97 family phage portal protein
MGKLFRPRNEVISTSAGLDAFLRLGGMTSWAGIAVTPQNALQVAAVFACTRNIAEDIGKLPFPVYHTAGDRERATSSPFYRLIHDRPNSFQTSQQFREYLTASALLRGNGYALKNVVNGQVRELLPLHPDQVDVEQLPDFELLYHVTMDDGRQETLTKREVFHLPGLTIPGQTRGARGRFGLANPPIGVSVITYARQTLGIALGAARHAGTFFANGLKPSGIFKHPGKLSDKAYERLKAELKEKHGGENSNDTLLLEEGMEFAPITLTNKDSQLLESRTFEVVEICRWFRMPPHKIGELSRATFSNIEHQAIEYVSDTLMPWAKRWEYAVNQQVIVTNSIYAEFNFDALLRGTTLERYQAYQIAAGGNAPWLSRNEVRRLENKPTLAGLDDVLQPLNMTATGGEEADANAAA